MTVSETCHCHLHASLISVGGFVYSRVASPSQLFCCFLLVQLLSCGGDALVKLWDVGSSECINTFDEHEDRIWSVKFAGESESKMITGGSDSVLTIWDDSTVDDEEGEAAKIADETLKEQKLANALQVLFCHLDLNGNNIIDLCMLLEAVLALSCIHKPF